jgi:hypothetical protein
MYNCGKTYWKNICIGGFCYVIGTFYLTARTNTENLKQIFPEKELRGHSPNFYIHVFVSDLYIPMINLLLQEICGPILGIYKLLTDT